MGCRGRGATGGPARGARGRDRRRGLRRRPHQAGRRRRARRVAGRDRAPSTRSSRSRAARAGTERVEDGDPADWQWMFDVNVLSAQRLVSALLPQLRRAAASVGHSDVLFVTSTAAQTAYPGGGGYNAAKAAESMLAHALRLELNGEPIRVVEIAPGMVHTEEFTLNRLAGDRIAAEKVYQDVEAPLTAADVADVIAYALNAPGPRQSRPRDDAAGRAVGAAPAGPRTPAPARDRLKETDVTEREQPDLGRLRRGIPQTSPGRSSPTDSCPRSSSRSPGADCCRRARSRTGSASRTAARSTSSSTPASARCSTRPRCFRPSST